MSGTGHPVLSLGLGFVSATIAFVELVACTPPTPPDAECGTRTILEDNECRPRHLVGVSCGVGTKLVGHECVLADPCGPGTFVRGDRCFSSVTSATCNPGTLLDGDQCVAPPPVTCAPGAALLGNRCVSLAINDGGLLAVRFPTTRVPSNGYARIPVLTVGALLDGTPSTEPVVLTVSPPSAGTISPDTFALDPLGTTSWFTPCRSALPGCLGTFEITLARAGAPGDIIATTGPVALVAPDPVGSALPCLAESEVLFLEGDAAEFIHPGTETIVPEIGMGAWASPDAVWVEVQPAIWDQIEGSYALEFESVTLRQPLSVNIYRDTQRAYLTDVGRPGFSLVGNGRACNLASGAFQIHHMTWAGDRLVDFLASFEQRCDAAPSVLRGCVHYRR